MTRLTVDRTSDRPKNWRATKPWTSGRRPEDRDYRNAGDVHDGTGDTANESDDFLWLRPVGRLKLTTSRTELGDEASTDGSAHRTLTTDRNVSQV